MVGGGNPPGPACLDLADFRRIVVGRRTQASRRFRYAFAWPCPPRSSRCLPWDEMVATAPPHPSTGPGERSAVHRRLGQCFRAVTSI